MKEIPKAQKYYGPETSEIMRDGTKFWLQMICEHEGIKSDTIGCVAELGAGRGISTKALLDQFPKATIHTIDYWDILPPEIKSDPRVVFHQGFLTDVLASLPELHPDLTILRFIGFRHGFNAENINCLRQFVGAGILVVQGDSDWLEYNSWFRDAFALVPGSFIEEYIMEDTYLWRAKADKK